MSKGTIQRYSKQDMDESKTGLEQLGDDALRKIGSHLPIKDMQRAESQLQHPSQGKNKFFQEALDEARMAKPLLKAVVIGNPDALIVAILRNPPAFFMRGDIKDPAGQVFYRVSAAQMIAFLCDDDMKMLVERAISKVFSAEAARAFIQQWQEQVQALGRGGADLIKLDCHPLDPNFMFAEVLQFKKTYKRFDDTTQLVCYSLLENPDGIAYYKDEENQVYWYYINLNTQTITLVELTPITIPDDCSEAEQEILIAQQQTYDNLLTIMDAMEPMSAKRSSNAEHQVIARMMRAENKPVKLVRQGIQYERNGECYCDSHHDFNRQFNGYRKCIRIYAEERWDEGDRVFCEELHQDEVIWLLQRFCEKNRPFYPLPDFKSSPFQRGFNILSFVRDFPFGGFPEIEAVYNVDSGCFAEGFGSYFAVYRPDGRASACGGKGLRWFGGELAIDFIAVNRLVEDAKVNIAEFKFDQDFMLPNSLMHVMHPYLAYPG